MVNKKRLLDSLTHEDRENILLRNWMSHDGHWFRNVAEEFGPEAANMRARIGVKTDSEMKKLQQNYNDIAFLWGPR